MHGVDSVINMVVNYGYKLVGGLKCQTYYNLNPTCFWDDDPN